MRRSIILAVIFTLTFWYAPGHAVQAAETPTTNQILAACLTLEAAGEGTIGMTAVINVIHTRSTTRGKSLRQVVTRRWQFSCFNSVTVDNAETWAQVVKRASRRAGYDDAMELVKTPPTDITGGADHYFTTSIKPPKWSNAMTKTKTIGHHVFYRSHR